MGSALSDQRAQNATPRSEAAGVLIDRHEHPYARRIRDVLRPSNQRSKFFVIDDGQNIVQAAEAGVQLDSLYLAHGSRAEDASAIAKRVGAPIHTVLDAVNRELFGVEKRSRVFAIARDPRRPTLNDLTN